MQRVSNGYTIIEVLIFLAVSGMIFFASITVINGKSGHTQFTESMRDLNSKIQDWVNDVSTGYPGSSLGQKTCTITAAVGNPRLRIDDSAPPASYSPSCVFIGKAIQFTDSSYSSPSESSKVYAYSVFGRRLNDSNELVSSMREALPTAPMGKKPPNFLGNTDLSEEFNLPGSIRVTKVATSPSTTPTSHLAGFYSSFNNEQSTDSNGSQDLKAFQYPLDNQAFKADEVFDCLAAIGETSTTSTCARPGLDNPAPLNTWTVCLSDGVDTGVLTITSSPSGLGASTRMEFKPCP